ncbi:TonB-dependent receptor plug domain-containing protein [Porticoccus sp. W117]|uniref:TonB-dependent receptor plug domain-containing protein n=1 Tax=Porticoccus sp. W117 TaxID=3054777 RepID=UPI00259896AF|nr:TonB-dependent receptor plug domain-containing protein [Porticoccus sp. W117]MDM3871974.1 TonB-dependent receptor plug domain-containing protein [Porticoccus sp. W117]
MTFLTKPLTRKIAAHSLLLSGALSLPVLAQGAEFDIRAQSLDKALAQLSSQADMPIVAPQNLLSGKSAESLSGSMSTEQALDTLLKGSGLTYNKTGSGQIVIVPVAAESESGDASDDAALNEADEEVIVTGSALIKDPGQVTKNVISFSRDKIELSGATSLEELLRRVPQNVNAATETASAFAGNFGGARNVFGASGINLRGLGEAATLILIDGRRTAGGGILGNAVDITNIPLAQVERVDILFDGASSIYGADAIGGVVNIITRKDYEGGTALVEYQGIEDGGTSQSRVVLTKSFSWDTGNLGINYSYEGRSALSGEERPNLRFQAFGSGISGAAGALPVTDPASIASTRTQFFPVRRSLPLFYVAPDGTRFQATELQITPFGSLRVVDITPDPSWTPVFNAQFPGDGQDLTLQNAVIGVGAGDPPTDGRNLIPARTDHSIRFNLNQELWGETELFASVAYGTSKSFASVTQQELTVGSQPLIVENFMGVVNPDNPFLVQYQTNVALPGLPNQTTSTGRTSVDVNFGLKGELGDGWQWEVGALYSELENDGKIQNELVSGIRTFLEFPTRNTINIFDPVTQMIAPREIQGNYSISTGQSFLGESRETFMADFLSPEQPIFAKNNIREIQTTVQGPLLELPAGNLNALFRLGYKEEEQETLIISAVNRIVVEPGLFGRPFESNAIESLGTEETTFLAAEFFVPLVTDVPGVADLSLSLSGRVDDVNYFDDNTSNYGYGLNWTINEELKIQLNRSDAFNAPDFGAFAAPVFLDHNISTTPFFLGATEDFSRSYIASFITGGNQDLLPLESTSNSVSLQYTPRWLEGFNAKITWHKERLRNEFSNPVRQAIQSLDFTTLPTEDFLALYPNLTVGNYEPFRCEAGQMEIDVDGIVLPCINGSAFNLEGRTEAHFIFDQRVTNGQSTNSSGVDVRLSYFTDTDYGSFDVLVDYARQNTMERRAINAEGPIVAGGFNGADQEDALANQFVDIVGSTPSGTRFVAVPEDRLSATVSWEKDGLRLSLNGRYVSDVSSDRLVDISAFDPTTSDLVLQTTTVSQDPIFDLTAIYDFNEMENAPALLKNARLRLSLPDITSAETTRSVSPTLPTDQLAPLVPQFVSSFGRTYTLSLEKTF